MRNKTSGFEASHITAFKHYMNMLLLIIMAVENTEMLTYTKCVDNGYVPEVGTHTACHSPASAGHKKNQRFNQIN